MPTGTLFLPGPKLLSVSRPTTCRDDEIAAIATRDPTLYGTIIVRTGVIHPGEKTRP